jgi:hypothetical protein
MWSMKYAKNISRSVTPAQDRFGSFTGRLVTKFVDTKKPPLKRKL